MKLHIISGLTAIALATAAMSSCSDKNEWTVNGQIEGAEGQTMIVEASDNGFWYELDSVKVDDSGRFKYSHAAAGYPDIYRLRLGDKTLYFPIDSIECVTVTTKADAFDNEYTITGSESADKLMAVDRRLAEAARKSGMSSLFTDSLLKRELSTMLLGDPAGIVSYYIINKRVQGLPLFNPQNRNDLRIIGAVANAYSQFRPNDPRTRYLEQLFLSNKSAQRKNTDTIAAPEIQLIDLDMIDVNGKHQRLSRIAEQNRVVILNFTAYTGKFSPALNVILNRLYERYHGQGLQIYQIGVDPDEFQWRQSAKNLPWIAVYSPTTDQSAIMAYNVGAVPMSFVISNGEIAERVIDPDKLENAVIRRM